MTACSTVGSVCFDRRLALNSVAGQRYMIKLGARELRVQARDGYREANRNLTHLSDEARLAYDGSSTQKLAEQAKSKTVLAGARIKTVCKSQSCMVSKSGPWQHG